MTRRKEEEEEEEEILFIGIHMEDQVWSPAGNTLRSATQQRMLTPRRCIWRWLSTQAYWELLVSRSGKGFLLASCHARPWRAVGARAAWRYASMRVWVPNVYQWMMIMSLNHDVSACVLVYFGVIVQKKNDGGIYCKIPKKTYRARALHPQCLAEVVIAEPWLCASNFNQINTYSCNKISSSWLDNSLLRALDPSQVLWLCQLLEGDTQSE